MDDTDLINSVIKSVTASRDIAPSTALKGSIAKTALREKLIKLPLIFLRSQKLLTGPHCWFDSTFFAEFLY